MQCIIGNQPILFRKLNVFACYVVIACMRIFVSPYETRDECAQRHTVAVFVSVVHSVSAYVSPRLRNRETPSIITGEVTSQSSSLISSVRFSYQFSSVICLFVQCIKVK